MPANTLPISPYWLLIPDIVASVGRLLIVCFTLDFCMAQTPISLRGIMIGLGAATLLVALYMQKGVILILSHFNLNKVTPSCGFYYYLVLSILLLLSLLLFAIAAKRHKLRERERHVNIQAIVEEHYERYFDQEEEYMREAANMYRTFDK